MRLNGIGVVWAPAYAQIDLKNATLTMQDGATPANSITVKLGAGNLTYSEKKTIEYTLDRGALDEVREGDEVPMDVTLDFVWEYIAGTTGTAGIPTVEDALKNIGAAVDWVSSDSDTCRPFSVDLIVSYVPDCASGDNEVITLPDFRYESLDHDLRAGTVSVSGKCNAKEATVVRSAKT